MIAIIASLVVVAGPACVPADFEAENAEERNARLASDVATLGLAYHLSLPAPALENAACATDYSANNDSAYLSAGRGWQQDSSPARLVVLGDSTMDISTRIPGFLSPDAHNRAISGNTICDMHRQLPAVQLSGISEIFVSTADGNGVLQNVDSSVSIRAGKALIDRLRERWPAARITVAGIHPTLIAFLNAKKGAVNGGIKTYIEADANGCYLDPLPVFGVAEGVAASPARMLDEVHYSFAMSLAIREAAFSQCGVQL